MTQSTPKKQGFKKCRSATFSIDGFSFTIGKRQAYIVYITLEKLEKDASLSWNVLLNRFPFSFWGYCGCFYSMMTAHPF